MSALANIVIILHFAVVKRQQISGGEQPCDTNNAEKFGGSCGEASLQAICTVRK